MNTLDIKDIDIIKYYENHSLSDCEKHFSLSRYKIKNILKENGIPIRTSNKDIKKDTASKHNVNIDLLREFYITHNISQCCERFNISRPTLDKIFTENSINKHPVSDSISIGVQSKYGVSNIMDVEAVKNSIKESNLSKYGTESFFASNVFKEQNKKTLMERYGVSHSSQITSSREKAVNTSRNHFGDDNYNNRAKAKQTSTERYGVPYAMQNSDIVKKASNSCIEKYGVAFNCMRDEARMSGNNSKPNQLFAELLDSNSISYEREFVIGNYQYDFKIGNILVEINPTITHNITYSPFNHPVSPDYHKLKSIAAQNAGFRCIHVWDWDDIDKIIYLLKSKDRQPIYARNCIVEEIGVLECTTFMNTNHLQNSVKSDVRLGLYHDNDLVSVMTFGRSRYNKNYEYELLRYCSSANVIGGAGKLFKYFVQNYSPSSIISYCDNSKFAGDVYIKLGFKLKSFRVNPSKHWYNLKSKKHITDNLLRQLGADKLLGTSFGKFTDNEQIMRDNGFFEVYDCGQSSYIWKNNE